MNMLRAYHGDKKVKKLYLDRVMAHRKADEVVQGFGYWNDGKGCAVGCTIHGQDHKRYETELGIPEWLARVEDTLFEGMSKEKARTWPERFLKAIRPGADLSKAEAPFVIFILKSLNKNYDTEKHPDIKASIKTCIDLYKKGDLAPSEAWSAAESATRSAAWSAAESATRSAAESAAWSATRSATRSAAESAAESAAWSAAESATRSAAWSAAWSAAYEKYADKLLEILRSL